MATVIERNIVIWAVVDKNGEVVGAYTNRLSAIKRVEYLDKWGKEDKKYFIGPFNEIRCEGKFK